MKTRWASVCMVAGLFLAVLAGTVQALTWGEWVEDSRSARLDAIFHDFYPDQRTKATDSRDDALLKNRVYIGELVFTPAEGKPPPEGPFHVRLFFFKAGGNELDWPPLETQIQPGFRVRPLPHKRMPAPFKTVYFPPQTAWPLRVPVEPPQADYGDRKSGPCIFPAYKVEDAQGRLLCRGFLDARKVLYGSSPHTFVGADEDDKSFQTLVKSSGNWEKIDHLREPFSAYRGIRNIWFTPALWESAKPSPDFLRRLLLLGINFCSGKELLPEIRAELQPGQTGVILLGGITDEPVDSWRDSSLSRLELYSRHPGAKPPEKETDEEKTMLANATPVFAPDKAAYLCFSIACFCVFLLGTGVLLVWVFGFRHGEQRIVVWVLLPAWAVFCAIAFYAAGLLLLNRQPRLDVTEYRLGVGGWPEMCCRAVAKSYAFQEGRPIWHAPHGTWGSWNASSDNTYLDGFWKTRTDWPGPVEDRYELAREMGGNVVCEEFIWFEPAAFPLHKEGAPDSSALVVADDLDGLWLLADGQWLAFGAVKAGVRLQPEQGEAIDALSGLPDRIAQRLDSWTRPRAPCTDPTHDHYDSENAEFTFKIPASDWITVALKTNMPPRVKVDWSRETIEKGRTIWVTQWP